MQHYTTKSKPSSVTNEVSFLQIWGFQPNPRGGGLARRSTKDSGCNSLSEEGVDHLFLLYSAILVPSLDTGGQVNTDLRREKGNRTTYTITSSKDCEIGSSGNRVISTHLLKSYLFPLNLPKIFQDMLQFLRKLF